MSIWCSLPTITPTAPEVDDYDVCAGVWSYVDGFSNRYPAPDDGKHIERPACIDLADMPEWCVPGHVNGDENNYVERGPWLRLGIHGWRHDYSDPTNPAKGAEEYATVVLDEDAAKALHAQLSEWLAAPKARPKAAE